MSEMTARRMGFQACGHAEPVTNIGSMRMSAARVPIGWSLLALSCLAGDLRADHAGKGASSADGSRKTSTERFDARQFRKFCGQLGDERFKVRRNAENGLHQMLHQFPVDGPNPVEAACYKEWSRSPDPEVRARLESVLTDFAMNMWGPKAFLGVAAVPEKSFDENGKLVSRVRIQNIAKGSPAEKAGLKAGDFLRAIGDLHLDGQAGASEKLVAYLAAKQSGDPVILSVSSEGKTEKKQVVLGHGPWVQAKADSGKPAPPPDPKHCFRVYLAKKRGGK